MNKIILAILVVGVILVGGFFWLNNYIYTEKQGGTGFQKDYKNSTYNVEGEDIALNNGVSEAEILGSASKIVTRYFGNEAYGDVDGDGISDVAFVLTQNQGGSGTFYYVVVALKTNDGYRGTNAMLLGDRIAPQSTEIKDGVIAVNYADRKPGEPMTAEPTVGVSKYFKIENGVLSDKSLVSTWGMNQVLTIGKSVRFADGLEVELTKINDSRCKQGVVCIWAGELSPVLMIHGGMVQNHKEIMLGTTTKQSLSDSGYVFNLKETNETSAALSVIKN